MSDTFFSSFKLPILPVKKDGILIHVPIFESHFFSRMETYIFLLSIWKVQRIHTEKGRL
jgi:hypothetical protein